MTRDGLGLAAILAATFMGQVDGFIVTVAAPSLQRDLPATFGQVQLVGAVYVLAAAAGLVTGGRLGDRFGRRRVFLAGVAVFTLASLVCGLAPSPEVLIVARFVQGAAAAALIPQELALIRTIFLDETRRTRAMSLYGVALGLGVIFGLAGGGLLVHWNLADLGWRSAFLINVPIGLAILAMGRLGIDEARSTTAPGLDLAGAALTAVALPALLIPIILGPEHGAWIWTSAVVGVATVAVLARQQRAMSTRGREPLFPPRVLTAPGLPTGLTAIMTFFGGNAGLFLVYTYYTQTGLNHDPLAAGLMFVPLGIGFVTGSAVSGNLATRIGPRLPAYGCAFLALTLATHLAVVHTPVETQTVLLGVAIGLVGLAEGLVVSPLIGAIFNRVSPDDAGAVSGAAATTTQFGLALGFAAVGSWYRLILGTTPGAPTTLADHSRAYSAAIGVLIALAIITAMLCLQQTRTPRMDRVHRVERQP